MLVRKQWSHESEVFEFLAEALEDSELKGTARDERSSYGDDGYIIIAHEGRRFYLQLWEEV